MPPALLILADFGSTSLLSLLPHILVIAGVGFLFFVLSAVLGTIREFPGFAQQRGTLKTTPVMPANKVAAAVVEEKPQAGVNP